MQIWMGSELEPLGNALLEPLFLVAKRLRPLGNSVFLLAPEEAEHQADSACSTKPPWLPGGKIGLGGDDREPGGCVRGRRVPDIPRRARQSAIGRCNRARLFAGASFSSVPFRCDNCATASPDPHAKCGMTSDANSSCVSMSFL